MRLLSVKDEELQGREGRQVLQDKFWHIKYNIDKLANLQGPEEKKRREKRKEKRKRRAEKMGGKRKRKR